IAIVLTLIARPLAVVPVLKSFGFDARETGLVAWVGLRGSVPIILAIFPLMFGLPSAELIFNVVFFVVLISATVQGSTLPWLARKLGLTEKPLAAPSATLEITALGDVNADIVKYTLGEDSRAVGRRLSQTALPDGTVVAMITRGSEVIPPRGSTELRADDHLFVVMRPEMRAFVDVVFSQALVDARNELPPRELKLKGSTRVEDLGNSYGISLNAHDQNTLDEILRHSLSKRVEVDDQIILDGITLCVREMVGPRIATVGLVPAEPAGEQSQVGT